MDDDLFEAEGIPEDVLDHLDEAEIRRAWPVTLVNMLDVAQAALRREGLDEPQASRLAACILQALSHYHGGRMWYLPRGERLANALRDRKIFEQMRRGGAKALAAEHRLTEQRIYEIYREQRALFQRRHQRELFEDG